MPFSLHPRFICLAACEVSFFTWGSRDWYSGRKTLIQQGEKKTPEILWLGLSFPLETSLHLDTKILVHFIKNAGQTVSDGSLTLHGRAGS